MDKIKAVFDGKKTWIAAAFLVIGGGAGFVMGWLPSEAAFWAVGGGLGLVGLGGKLEKVKGVLEKVKDAKEAKDKKDA